MKVNEIATNKPQQLKEGLIYQYLPEGEGYDKDLLPDGVGVFASGMAAGAVSQFLKSAAARASMIKILERVALPRLANFIPGFGFAAGLFFAAHALMRTDKTTGDWDPDVIGAMAEAGAGFAGGSVKGYAVAWILIAFIVYREFYNVTFGRFPVEDWWQNSSNANYDFVERHKDTNATFTFVWEFMNNWIRETIGLAPEVIAQVSDIKAKGEEEGATEEDKSLTAIFNHLSKD